jgi:hypothetical protein
VPPKLQIGSSAATICAAISTAILPPLDQSLLTKYIINKVENKLPTLFISADYDFSSDLIFFI